MLIVEFGCEVVVAHRPTIGRGANNLNQSLLSLNARTAPEGTEHTQLLLPHPNIGPCRAGGEVEHDHTASVITNRQAVKAEA